MIQTKTTSPRANKNIALTGAIPLTTRIARTMIELQYSGKTVDMDTLGASGFTSKEISENWVAARDEAITLERGATNAA